MGETKMGMKDNTNPHIDDKKYDEYEKNPKLIIYEGEFGILHYGGLFWFPGILVGWGSFFALCTSALYGDSDLMPFLLLMTLVGGGATAFGVYLDRRLGWYARWKAWKRDLDEIELKEKAP